MDQPGQPTSPSPQPLPSSSVAEQSIPVSEPSGPSPNRLRTLAWHLLTATVTAILAVTITASVVGTEPAVAEATEGTEEAEPDWEARAIEVCREEVLERLKAPASAQWPGDEKIEHLFGKTYRVSGEVDSQNGFGALIRTTWSCETTRAPDGDLMVDHVYMF